MLRLVWSMRRDGDELQLDYTVHNDGAAPVLVADSLLFNNVVEPLMVIVSDDDEANTVAFRRGNVKSKMKSYFPHPVPTAVELPPEGEMARIGRVPLPLEAFHNIDEGIRPLRTGNTHAILEVGWIEHPEAAIVQKEIAKGVVITTTAHWGFQRWLRGNRLSLPA